MITTKTDKSIKQMLQEGTSPEELINLLQKDIDSAQEEIKKEQANTLKISDARNKLINAMLDYFITLNIIKPSENDNELKKSVSDTLERFEEEESMMTDSNHHQGDIADFIIRTLLRTFV